MDFKVNVSPRNGLAAVVKSIKNINAKAQPLAEARAINLVMRKAKTVALRQVATEINVPQKLVTVPRMVSLVALPRLWLNRQMNSTEKITKEFLDMIRRINYGNGNDK